MRIAVIGAGSWGTTIADLLAREGHDVRIWAYEPEVVASINRDHENPLFLPDAQLHEALTAVSEIAAAVDGSDMVVSAAPSHVVRTVGTEVGTALGNRSVLLVSVSKGLEAGSLKPMSEVLRETVPSARIVALSGPSFAKEVYQRQPTAVVAASDDPESASATQQVFSTETFRVYTSDDMLGVQLGGALKNVIAIAAGILSGLGLGNNSRAALITRALAEMTRVGEALGAKAHTFAGLAGIGDLMLTATGDLSRNRSLGIELARGDRLDDILSRRRTVAEGVGTARTAIQLGERTGVELPIAEEVHHILFTGKAPEQAVRALMGRRLKPERWE